MDSTVVGRDIGDIDRTLGSAKSGGRLARTGGRCRKRCLGRFEQNIM